MSSDGSSTAATSAEPAFETPLVDPDSRTEIAGGVHVISDRRVNLVCNIGIVVGERAALVVDTGMGRANGERVLSAVRELTDKPLYVTLTHFHPEHGFGISAFADAATLVYPRAQRDELAQKEERYLEQFRALGANIEELLADYARVLPDIAYEGEVELDLGGRVVQLRHVGPAHTRGDQIVIVPDEEILFTGDLVEDRFFPVYPPGDPDPDVVRWISLLGRLAAAKPKRVVPGHGDVGGSELITAYRDYLVDVRERVRSAYDSGRELDDYKGELHGQVVSDYPEWGNPEWMMFTINGLHADFEEDRTGRWSRGLAAFASQMDISPDEVFPTLRDRMGERAAVEAINGSGGAWTEDVLSMRDRSLIALAAQITQGLDERVRWHGRWALTNGATAEELEATAALCCMYAGYPAGTTAADVLQTMLREVGAR